MAKKPAPAAAATPPRPPYMLIEEIRVQGYKSFATEQVLHVRPLTLLAGTNSSGKSSIMQPLLLLKQTMEAPYRPSGALLLDGAHVQVETAEQVLTIKQRNQVKDFALTLKGLNLEDKFDLPIVIGFVYEKADAGFVISSQYTSTEDDAKPIVISSKLSEADISEQFMSILEPELRAHYKAWLVEPFGPFLGVNFITRSGKQQKFRSSGYLEGVLSEVIHIPGLRRKPERSYPATYFHDQIRGTFDLYAAGTVSQWQEQGNTEALTKLNDALRRLGLTDSVTAKVKNANEVELSVSRLPAGSKGKLRKADMVNIADVGIGVSQVLPIVVALIAAQEGQIVYVEQPELHLHPYAQVEMGKLLAEAARRGVRVIVETHSSLLLLTVQTMVAEGELKPDDVGLHWFSRDAKGATAVRYEQPDENGAYGDWPEDFGDVEMTAQRAYLDAVSKRRAQRTKTAKA